MGYVVSIKKLLVISICIGFTLAVDNGTNTNMTEKKDKSIAEIWDLLSMPILDSLLSEQNTNHNCSGEPVPDPIVELLREFEPQAHHNNSNRLTRNSFRDSTVWFPTDWSGYTSKSLSYEEENVTAIYPHTFECLRRLNSLSLANNHLSRLHPWTFNGLERLRNLDLSNNKVQMLPPTIFPPHLLDLNLNDNLFTAIPPAILHVPHLTVLLMNGNLIHHLKWPQEQHSTFDKLYDLYIADFSRNRIEIVDATFFQHMNLISAISLDDNKISYLHPDTFKRCVHLQHIQLINNQITRLDSGLFSNLGYLKTIQLQGNKLTGEITLSAFMPQQLVLLNISGNQIEKVDLGNIGNIALDASFNKIKNLSASASTPRETFFVLLTSNLIETFTPTDVFGERVHSHTQSPIVAIGVDGNPLKCDCRLSWLHPSNVVDCRRDGYTINHVQDFNVFDSRQLFCRLPYHHAVDLTSDIDLTSELDLNQQFRSPNCDTRNRTDVAKRRFVLKTRFSSTHNQEMYETKVNGSADSQADAKWLISEVPRDKLICPYETTSVKTNLSCPASCLCYHTEDWKVNVVDCSSQDVHADDQKDGGRDNLKILGSVPTQVTQLHLEGNGLTSVRRGMFVKFENLTDLFLTRCQIELIEKKGFEGIHMQLRSIHLDCNHLTRILGFEFQHLSQLEEIHLQRNQIKFIHSDAFGMLRRLKILNLNDNQLTSLVNLRFSHMHLSTLQFSLKGNPLPCDCHFVEHPEALTVQFRRSKNNDQLGGHPDQIYNQFDAVHEYSSSTSTPISNFFSKIKFHGNCTDSATMKVWQINTFIDSLCNSD